MREKRGPEQNAGSKPAMPAPFRSFASVAPRFRNLSPPREVVNDEDHLVVVITVEDFYVDAGLRHPAREQAELAGDILFQPLHENFPSRKNPDASRFQGRASGDSILEEKMRHAAFACGPGASALDADTGAPQSFSHFGKRAGSILQDDR